MAVRIDPIIRLKSTDEINMLNRMLRDLGRAVNGLVSPSNVYPATPSSGTTDHHLLTNLTIFDDHTQYLYLPGRALPGQAVKGRVSIYGNTTVSPLAVFHVKGEIATIPTTKLIGDVTKPGTWSTDTGAGGTWYTHIDEDFNNINTNDWLISATPSPDASMYEGLLDIVPARGGVTLKIHAKCASGSQQIFLQLIDAATNIASSLAITLTTSFATYSYPLTAGEYATIVHFNDLRLRFGKQGLGIISPFTVAAAWVEVPGGPGGKTIIAQADALQTENLLDFMTSAGVTISKVLVDGSVSLGQNNHIDTVSSEYAQLYAKQQYATNQVGIIVEGKTGTTKDLIAGYDEQVSPGIYGNKQFGITRTGDYYIQNVGKFAAGDDGAPAIKAITGDDLVEFLRSTNSWTDVKFSATLAFGWNSTVTGVFAGLDGSAKCDRFGFCVNEGVLIANLTRTTLTPPLALLHVKNAGAITVIPVIAEAVVGQTANITEFRKNGVLLSAIDKDGNFTGITSGLSLIGAKTVEVDLGATPIWQGRFTITDAAITTASKLLVWQAPGPYTGKGTRADEADIQPIMISSVVAFNGSATVNWQTPPAYTDGAAGLMGLGDIDLRKGYVKGNVKFNYTVHALATTKIRSIWIPAINMVIESGGSTLGNVGTTPNTYHVWSIDNTADAALNFSVRIPEDYSGGNMTCWVYYSTTKAGVGGDAGGFYCDFDWLSVGDVVSIVSAANTLDDVNLFTNGTLTKNVLYIRSMGTFSTGIAVNNFLRCRFKRDVTAEILNLGSANRYILQLVGIKLEYTATS